MRKTLTVMALMLVFLGLLDLAVSGVLRWAAANGRMGSVVPYFEYGRSVPGKLARWEADPNMIPNLYDVSWSPDVLTESAAGFAAEDPGAGPVVRSYGMSFVNNILQAARDQDPGLIWDPHAGPGAPPNYTFALFEDDAANRRAGDIAVLGILSSSVPAMAALSNRTWAFEQPAPFTYPIFRPEGDGLARIIPLVGSRAAQRALARDPQARAAWAQQLQTQDAFYAPVIFGLTWADASPFARLVRRSLAKRHVTRVETDILTGGYPYALVLERMVAAFARQARADGQHPVVLLVQTRGGGGPDLLATLKPVLTGQGIPYLATAEHLDLQDPSVFLPDGHYRPDLDRRLGAAFLEMIGR